VPLHWRDVALLLQVQSSRESPKSGGVPLSAFAHGTLALPAKSPCSLDLHPWSPNSHALHHWSPNSPRRAVTTRIRRVSGKRPAICCCFYLWGVIQLLTFPPYFGKHLKLVPTLRRFLAYPSLRVLGISAALPRCSLDAPSTLFIIRFRLMFASSDRLFMNGFPKWYSLDLHRAGQEQNRFSTVSSSSSSLQLLQKSFRGAPNLLACVPTNQ